MIPEPTTDVTESEARALSREHASAAVEHECWATYYAKLAESLRALAAGEVLPEED